MSGGFGPYLLRDEPVFLNRDRRVGTVTVRNLGDRPIQVGSHFHFFEVNKFLDFDRAAAFGMRLNVPSGTAVRFEPGDTREVQLVEIGGERMIHGFNGLTEGSLDAPGAAEQSLARASRAGFRGAALPEERHG